MKLCFTLPFFADPPLSRTNHDEWEKSHNLQKCLAGTAGKTASSSCCCPFLGEVRGEEPAAVVDAGAGLRHTDGLVVTLVQALDGRLVQATGHEASPACLVGRAHTTPSFGVEVLVEEHKVVPTLLARVQPLAVCSVARAVAVLVLQKQPVQPGGDDLRGVKLGKGERRKGRGWGLLEKRQDRTGRLGRGGGLV